MALKKFNVLTAIEHDNERVEAGASVDLDDKAAKPLLAVGAIEEATAKKSADANKDAK